MGVEDSACHSYKNKRTNRTEPLYKGGGTIYIYLCYGLHYLFNIVSGEENQPEAVLIRAVVGAEGPARTTKLVKIAVFIALQTVCGARNNPRKNLLC